LPHARLAVTRQHAALAVARGLQRAGEHVAFALPAEQLLAGSPRDDLASMPLVTRLRVSGIRSLPAAATMPPSRQLGKE
jgi:hypothetical protein